MENGHGHTVTLSLDIPGKPADVFPTLVDELQLALRSSGIDFEAAPAGKMVQNGFQNGTIVAWDPPHRLKLEWRQASWLPDEVTEVEMDLKPVEAGTQLTVRHRHWGGLIGDGNELTGWFSSEVLAPFLRATSPQALGDWITDRRARRPSGEQSRGVYRAPLFHYPNFRVLLSELALKPDDYLVEVGCGGGAFLQEALKSGCKAAAIDHSADMVRLARESNRDAVSTGRLAIVESSADHLPFPDATFTCAVMTGVFGFLSDPVRALSEIRRVLRRGGRLIAMGSDPILRGTPAAPEPMASRLHFYSDSEHEQMARVAGFNEVHVVRRDMEGYAREVGVPEPALPLFKGPGGPFIIAKA